MSNLKQGLKKLKAKGLKKGSKKKFPDLSGDGKVTKKDILMGRGVVKAGRGSFLTKRLKLQGLIPTKKPKYGSKEFERFDNEMKKFLSPKDGTTTKGMTQAQIKRMLDRIKSESAQKVTAKRAKLVGKGTSDAAKIGVGAAAALTAVEIDKAKKQKAAKKRGPKKSSKTSKADIIGKGAPKGRASGGSVGPLAKTYKGIKKRVGKDKITATDVQESLKLLEAGKKAGEAAGKKAGKAQGGMMTKGQGAAIRGTKFKGTF